MALALTASAAAFSAVNAQTYNVTVIPPQPGHSSVSANAINNLGEAVGVSYGSPITNQQPYIFRPGLGAQSLPFPPGYTFSVPTDINDAGVVVGYAQTTWSNEGHPIGWRYQNGTFTMFAPDSFAHNINNAGVAVGRSCLDSGFTPNLTCFFTASPGPAPAITSFGTGRTYPASNWRFVDINDANQIAYTGVYADSLAYLQHADGSVVQVTPPPAPYVRTFTWGINNAAQIIGRWEYNIGSQYFSRAFRWTEEDGAEVIGIPNVHVRPKGINSHGHVVGESGGNENSYFDMWLWKPGQGSVDIEPLIDPALQINVTGVSGINDAGQIIGRGISQLPPAPSVTFILTPAGALVTGDIDGDGDVDLTDADLFLSVLLGTNANPDHVVRSDVDGNGGPNGMDVQLFVNALIPG